MATTATAVIDAQGTKLFFKDSGPPPNSTDYTTLLIIHGSAFYGPGFYQCLDYAHARNLRIIIINRREYPNSSKFTDEEIAALKEGNESFLQILGKNTADFLSWYIDTNKIPKKSEDLKSGGIAILSWSMGNPTAIALLAHPQVIPNETYTKIEPYLKDLIIYDPPHMAFGYKVPGPNPDGSFYDPWTDKSLTTPEAAYNAFLYWVSSYYDHPPSLSRDISKLDFRPRTDKCSVDNIPEEVVPQVFDNDAAARSEYPSYFEPMQSTIAKQADRALFDEELTKTWFPNIRISYLGAARSCWHTVWAYIETKGRHEDFVAQGKKVRPIKFVQVADGNHFLHWDNPEEFIDMAETLIHAQR